MYLELPLKADGVLLHLRTIDSEFHIRDATTSNNPTTGTCCIRHIIKTAKVVPRTNCGILSMVPRQDTLYNVTDVTLYNVTDVTLAVTEAMCGRTDQRRCFSTQLTRDPHASRRGINAA